MPGKIDAPLNKKLETVKWGRFRLGDLFKFKGIKQAKSQKLIPSDIKGVPYIVQTMTNNMCSRYVDKDYLINNNEAPVKGNAIVLGVTLPAVSYQPKEFGASQVIEARSEFLNERNGLFFACLISKEMYRFSYQEKPGIDIYKNLSINLPITSTGKIDFAFMDSFISELKQERIRELIAYLKASELDDYTLTKEEKKAISDAETWEWGLYNLKDLYGSSTRGKRLKSADRLPGKLPFVTAGEAETGISAYISNNVEVFPANTTTIDMFGSAKYRNYKYGADDHVAVVHTENLQKHASIFVTSAIHKASHTGKFDYGNNFYASDADELYIKLPTKNGSPDYTSMQTYIRAIEKLVITDVVEYASKKNSLVESISNNN